MGKLFCFLGGVLTGAAAMYTAMIAAEIRKDEAYRGTEDTTIE